MALKKVSVLSLFFGILLIGSLAQAVNVVVPGTSNPWDPGLNPSFTFGYWGPGNSGGTSPIVVDSTLGLPMTIGDTLTVTYLAGLANAGGGGIWNDAYGDTGWNAVSSTYPGQYIGPTVYLEELLGVFANNGLIVGTPFIIGDGPVAGVIPSGATQLLLGFNDNNFLDDGGSVTVSVLESGAAVPVPATLFLLGPGFAGLAAVRRRFTK